MYCTVRFFYRMEQGNPGTSCGHMTGKRLLLFILLLFLHCITKQRPRRHMYVQPDTLCSWVYTNINWTSRCAHVGSKHVFFYRKYSLYYPSTLLSPSFCGRPPSYNLQMICYYNNLTNWGLTACVHWRASMNALLLLSCGHNRYASSGASILCRYAVTLTAHFHTDPTNGSPLSSNTGSVIKGSSRYIWTVAPPPPNPSPPHSPHSPAHVVFCFLRDT